MAQVFLALAMLVHMAMKVSSRPEGLPLLTSADTDIPADKPSMPADKPASIDMPGEIDYSVKYAYSSLESSSDPFSVPISSKDQGDVFVVDVSSVINPQTSGELPKSAGVSTSYTESSSSPPDSSSDLTFKLKLDRNSVVVPAEVNVMSSSVTDTSVSSADTRTTSLSWSPSYPTSEPKWDKDPLNLKRVLIEDLKKKILHGLKMTNAPTEVLNDTSFSTDVIKMLQEEKEISRLDQKENLVLHAIDRDGTCSRSNRSLCRRFTFNVTADMESVISAHAWFHKKMANERLVISAYSSTMKDEPLVILKEAPNMTKNKASEGWVTFELPKMLTLEKKDNYLLCTVEIEGADIDIEGDFSPFLVIMKHTEKLENKKREKRSTNENCNCCAEKFEVTLEEIGYQNFVFQPTKFNIKICKGICTESLSSYTINYQQIISSYYKLNNYPKPKCNFWAPRCEPDSYSPLRMVYKSKDGVLHDQEIANVIINSCTCM